MNYRSKNEMAWMLVATGSAVLAGIAARRLLKASWMAVRHADPPQNPIDDEVSWLDAAAWGAATGATVGLARVVARRGAAGGWRRYVGAIPS